MDSKTYWKNRETENLKNYLKAEETYAKEIQNIYSYMTDQITKEINGFYTKYAAAEGITMAEAKKRVSQADIEEYERKAAKYVKEKNFSDQANEEMRLYNATMKINRLELLKANIGLEMVDGFNELDQYYGEILADRAVEEFTRQAGILGKTVQNNAKMAASIVNASFKNATFSDRIWMYQSQMKAELSKLLQEGLIQGRNPRQLAVSLKKLFGVGQYNAERLMRTELARVQTDAQKQSFIANGFDEYQFNALGTACEICAAIDGKHFKIKDMMPGTNAPPMHPNCRCSTSAYMDGDEYNEWLDSYQEHGLTFEDWKQWRSLNESESSKNKYQYSDTVINKSVIDSADYRKRMNGVSDSMEVNRSIWKSAREILNHRSGTKYEDLAFIDSTTGKYKINKSYSVESRASMNKTLKKMLADAEPYTIVAVHNHPGSSVPSIADMQTCLQRKYKCGVVVCHDGKIYKYSVNETKFNSVNASMALDRFERKGYTDQVDKLLVEAGIYLEVL